MKRYTALSVLLMIISNVYSQQDTLNAIIQVENDYTPVVTKAAKQNHTPQIEITQHSTPLDIIFSQESQPFKRFVSERNVKDVLPQQEKRNPGYARFGYGNDNNIDAALSYRRNIGKNDKIEFIGTLNGFNTKMATPYGDAKRRFYNTWAEATYAHSFEKLTLGADINFVNRAFNYTPAIMMQAATNKQTYNNFGIKLKALSHNTGPFSYKATLGYQVHTQKYSAGENDKVSENHFSADGTLCYELTHELIRNIAADIAFDAFTYGGAAKNNIDKYNNYASVRINPYANYNDGKRKIRVGFHADILTANGSFLALAPDIAIESKIKENIVIYANVDGGRTLNTFERIEQLSPYQCYIPGNEQYTATYTIADVTAGTRISFEPFHIDLYAGYSYTKDEMMPYVSEEKILHTSFTQSTARNLYIGTRMGYDFGGWLKFATGARYDHQKCSGSNTLLLYKPMFTLDIDTEAHLYDGLYANIGYKFTGYTKVKNTRLKEANILNARLNYKLYDKIGIFAEGNNLLDSEHEEYPGYIAQGRNFIAGLSVNF